MKYLPLLFLLLIIQVGQSQSMINRLDGSQISIEDLEKEIKRLMEAGQVTGLAISIFNDHTTTYQKAFGYANLDQQIPLQTDQIFYGASLSKSLFGYLVAQFVHEGQIDLDQPVQSYFDIPIPELPFEKDYRKFDNLKNDDRYLQITPRMCMSHTTGFPNWRWLSPNKKLEFLFDPGTRYSYSGEGIMLMQWTLEAAIGQKLESLAKERIFGPLLMKQSSYIWQERFEENYSVGHTATQEVKRKKKRDRAGAAGSLETTLEDYSLFLQHLLQLEKKQSPVTKILFNPNVRIRSKMQFGPLAMEDTTAYDDIALSYALGWGVIQTPYGFGAFKEGHGDSFQHYSILFPEKGIGILMLSNSDNAERIFKYLLEIAIANTYTPWKWENYIPYDQR